MSYIDDWAGVPLDEQRLLQQLCEACAHMRHRHGSVTIVKVYGFRAIEHSPGRCTSCECLEFRADPLITKDDVIDATDRLAGDIRLQDSGIGPLMCPQKITSWTGLTHLERVCLLEFGHEGSHVT